MEWIALGWLGLFLVTFLSATVLPFSSELVVVLFIGNGFNPSTCLIIATIGNSLGGATNYFIGSLGKTAWFKPLGLTDKRLTQIENAFKRRGKYIAFFGFLPFIGDLILLVLGLFKTPIWSTLGLMTLGKAARYALLIFIII